MPAPAQQQQAQQPAPQQQPAQPQAAQPQQPTQAQQNWTWCLNPGKQFPADTSIKGCDAVIGANKDQPRDMANAYYNRGIAYRSKGNLDRAIDDFTQAIRLDSRESEFVNDRGAAYHAKGDIDRAIADYDKAIQLNPKAAEPYNNRGSAYQRTLMPGAPAAGRAASPAVSCRRRCPTAIRF
jgi:tetratricopeptide (TPR) repeat protein